MLRKITLPLDKNTIESLNAGDRILLSGYLYTARDAAHAKLISLLKEEKDLPIEIKDQTIYYAGPCPAPPGRVIGSVGPTTSGRMDAFTPMLLDKGLLGMIGKGRRSPEVIEAIKRNVAVYFGAAGGAGALISNLVKEVSVVAFEELGTEAIRKLLVEDFPVTVIIDASGKDLYTINTEKYKKQLN